LSGREGIKRLCGCARVIERTRVHEFTASWRLCCATRVNSKRGMHQPTRTTPGLTMRKGGRPWLLPIAAGWRARSSCRRDSRACTCPNERRRFRRAHCRGFGAIALFGVRRVRCCGVSCRALPRLAGSMPHHLQQEVKPHTAGGCGRLWPRLQAHPYDQDQTGHIACQANLLSAATMLQTCVSSALFGHGRGFCQSCGLGG
jgi:hypothetical protein